MPISRILNNYFEDDKIQCINHCYSPIFCYEFFLHFFQKE